MIIIRAMDPYELLWMVLLIVFVLAIQGLGKAIYKKLK